MVLVLYLWSLFGAFSCVDGPRLVVFKAYYSTVGLSSNSTKRL